MTVLTCGPSQRWTTRIVVLNEPLVTRGPFRYLRHPDYIVVVGEILVAPMVLGLIWFAVIFSLANGVRLAIRIKTEDSALRLSTQTSPSTFWPCLRRARFGLVSPLAPSAQMPAVNCRGEMKSYAPEAICLIPGSPTILASQRYLGICAHSTRNAGIRT
jgi:hypothetical protein